MTIEEDQSDDAQSIAKPYIVTFAPRESADLVDSQKLAARRCNIHAH
ncbi:hypothetical protein [Candidatus Bealeia paramacronuclearis]